MKLAIVADIHGNLEALSAVLDDITQKGIKNILCAGDLVGFGPNPNECVHLVRKSLATCVRGNQDDVAPRNDPPVGLDEWAKLAMKWTRKQLTDDNKKYLSELPLTRIVGDIFMAHGSPFDPLHEFVYEHDNIAHFVEAVKMPVIITAHTHKPFVRLINKTVWINPGSVGQPRDQDSRASYCVFDTESKKAEIIRVEYDLETTHKKIDKAKLPSFLGERLHFGK